MGQMAMIRRGEASPQPQSDDLSEMRGKRARRALARMSLALTTDPDKRGRYLERHADAILRQAKIRERQRYAGEPRMEAALDPGCIPMGSMQCSCRNCREIGHHGWPVGYSREARQETAEELHVRDGTEVGYECWLHAQSEWFLRSLPPSASFLRFDGR